MTIISSTFNNDIIIVGQQPWDTEIGSNCKNIAIELSKTNRVLYINSPLNRATIYRDKANPRVKKRLDVIKKRTDGLLEVQPNLWTYYPDCIVESINWINSVWIFNFLNKHNNRIFAKSIQKVLNRLNFKDSILFNDNEMFQGLYLKELLKPVLSIYYARDFMIAVEYWKKHGEVFEPLLIAKSDICFTNSEYLASYCKNYNQQSFNIGQGCDVEAFTAISSKEIKGLTDLAKPIIGYVGVLSSSRLDIEIIAHIAVSFPDCIIALVGPQDDVFKSSKLHQLKNVIFYGQAPVEELPFYIKAFTVCINPQLVNPITIGNYPRKIDEYLAIGKPVVATNTITMNFFAEYVYLADDKQQFVELISKAIIEDNDDITLRRQQYAYTHSWKSSVQDMRNKIQPILELNKTVAP